jgi:hypothetical protein
MVRYFIFNGDADGLCALEQLRLAEPGPSILVTGVKRDIALVLRVPAHAGDECTVLDVSLDSNRPGVLALLEAGAEVRYFDHHHAGELPIHPRFRPHIDLRAEVCTSLIVDRYLEGRHRPWAIVGAYGDNLSEQASGLCRELGIPEADAAALKELGVSLNYNSYGESIADLHVPPAELAEEMLGYPDPLSFSRNSASYPRVRQGYLEDMERARRLEPVRQRPGAIVFVLPAEAWARRASGVLANELSRSHAGNAIAVVSPKSDAAGYLVSVRVPNGSRVAADEFCRRFPSGGGRRTAAGINHLPDADLAPFATEFEQAFGASAAQS